MLKKLLLIGAVAAGLSACAYSAPVSVTPNLNVYSSYGEKIPGSFLLYVEDDGFVQTVKATGVACGAHTYPLDVRAAFKQSAIKTVEQLVESMQVVDAPVPVSALAAQRKSGMIVIKADTLQARFIMVPGFWSATADANADISASVSVDGQGGRLLGTTAAGSGNAQSEGGIGCGGASVAIGQATEKAMKQLLGQLGERLSNSQRLRSSGPVSGQ